MKRPLVTNKAVLAASPAIWNRSTPPASPRSLQESIQQKAEIDKTLEQFREKAKQEMKEVLKWGDD